MQSILVWDLPIRLFHGLLIAGFLTSFGIAQFGDDESPLFATHALIGLTLGFMWLLRIFWGLVGTRYARFESFLYRPGDLIRYLKEVMTGGTGRYVGHNPGSSAAILAMLVLLPGIVATGLMMQGGGDRMKDLHSLFAYAMLAVAAIHVAGVAVHTVRQRESIAMSMVHGRKEGAPEEGIRSAQPLIGMAFLLLTGLWTGGLIRNYDATTGQTVLPLVGRSVPLIEAGHGGGESEGEAHEEGEGDDD